jgi:glycosyltransferase involved in cell wall biosynthesis
MRQCLRWRILVYGPGGVLAGTLSPPTRLGRLIVKMSGPDWRAPMRGSLACEVEQIYQPPRRGEVIHNGVAPTERHSRKEEFVLAAGRLWDEAKNLSMLAHVAPELTWPVRVAGPLDGPDGDGRPAHLGPMQVLGNLERAALAAEMARAGIFVSLARYEPFGLTPLEAASHGCALVLSDIPTFRELWDGAAVFVRPNDRKGVRSAIHALCLDEARRMKLQQQARRRSAAYALQAQANAYERLYSKLIGAPRPVAAPASLELCA